MRRGRQRKNKAANDGHFDLLRGESRPRVGQQTRPSVLVAASGADESVQPGSQRLSSSKGHNRCEAATQRDRRGGLRYPRRLLCRRDRLRRRARPSRDSRRQEVRTKSYPDPGTGASRLRRSPPRFFSKPHGDSLGPTITTRKPTSSRGLFTGDRLCCWRRSAKRNTSVSRKVPPRK